MLAWLKGNFQNYSLQKLKSDILAGIIVGIVAIPLGMAFAIASGVRPEYGIYTTIIGGAIISILGGSKYQIGGPTGAFIPIILGIVTLYGYEDLLIAGFLAGVILLFIGLFKLGSFIRFIPKPVTLGFTSGIAVIIFTGQIANFLGLENVARTESFLETIHELSKNIATFNPYSILTALICFAIVIFLPKFFPKLPAPLIGIAISGSIAKLFYGTEVATIISSYGLIPSKLPSFHFLDFSIEKIMVLLPVAFSIAMLGGIESLLSAVVADGMTGTKHNSNKELVGQGIANILIPFWGGIPATGAIARTATNIKSGARSSVSGIIHAVFVLLTLLLFAPIISQVPLASMAPILMVVAFNMSERKKFLHLLKTRTSDSLVLLITFLLTVFINLNVAIQVGLLMSFIIFTNQMSKMLSVRKVLPDPDEKNMAVTPDMVSQNHNCPQISIFTIEGSLFFGAVETFTGTVLKAINAKPKVLILRMSHVIYLDTTGEASLFQIVKDMHKAGSLVLICGIRYAPKRVLLKTGLYEIIGKKHFFTSTGDAISYALQMINQEKCKKCKQNVFLECETLSSKIEIPREQKQIFTD